MLKYRNSFPMSDDLSLGILITDPDGNGLFSNTAYQELCGWSGAELIGSHWSAVIYAPDRDEALQHWKAAVQGQACFHFETRLERPNGELIKVRHDATQVSDEALGDGYIHTLENIHTNKDPGHVALDSIDDAVLSTDCVGRVSYMNALAETLTGFSRDEAIGRPLNEVFRLVCARSHKRIVDPAQRATQTNSIVTLEANALLVNKDGVKLAIEDSAAPIHNRYGTVTGAVIVFQDARFSRMAYLPTHDALTGLHNRNALYEHFEQCVALGQLCGKQIGMVFINLDNFKNINGTHGYDSGDIILTALATRLRTSVRATDTVCRYGGDEFVILLNEIEQPTQAFRVADKIRDAVAAPMKIAEYNIEVQLSIGVSVYPEDGETAEMLLRKAFAAMHQQKAGNLQPLVVPAPMSSVDLD